MAQLVEAELQRQKQYLASDAQWLVGIIQDWAKREISRDDPSLQDSFSAGVHGQRKLYIKNLSRIITSH